MKNRYSFFGLLAVLTLNLLTVTAEEVPEPRAQPNKPHGLYVSLCGDPAPAVLGFNYAFQMTPWMRFLVGFGLYSIGAGVRFTAPESEFSPVVGFSASTGKTYQDEAWAGISAGVGLEWRISSGPFVAMGANALVLPRTMSLLGLPYLNVGYFF